MMKKIYSLILSFVMVISMFCGATPIQASTTTSGDGWSLQNGVLTITKNIKRYLGYGWDDYSDEITKVVVKEGVISLDRYQFAGLTYLTSVTLPSTLKTIDYNAFADDVSLESISLPSGLTEVGSQAFRNTGIKSVVLPGAIYGEQVLADCVNLKSVTIQSGAELSTAMFNKCTRLQSIILEEGISTMPVNVFGYSFNSFPNLHYIKLSRDVKYYSEAINNSTVPSDLVIAGPSGYAAQKYAEKLKVNFYDTSKDPEPKSRFITCNDETYYFDANGYMVFGKQTINGTQYNFGTNGKMEKSKWISTNGKWWYRHPDGSYTKNDFELINGKWYYFDGNGYMVNGWKQVKNVWYYFDGSGMMVTGWKELNKTWYYFEGSGAMATGWRKINGYDYYFNGSGAMVKSTWVGDYYMDNNGHMVTNTWVGNYWCGADGKYVKSAWVDNNKFYVGSNGIYIPGQWQKDAKGWWYKVGSNFAKNITLNLDGKKYTFDANGYWIQ